ncbi:hypothetical protein HDU86_002952 [Geranomyces michiganensis]|nr:hypothetical protein HDU86_002952 [Geranomyces michiganensis]
MERGALLSSRPREPPPRNPYQEVLNELVRHALDYASFKAPASPRFTARKHMFTDELRRLVDNAYMSLPDKIDGVTELTQIYLGHDWEEDCEWGGTHVTAESVPSGGPSRERESRKRARTESLPEVAKDDIQPHMLSARTVVVSEPTTTTSSPGFLQNCPEDMLLYIFSHLDAQALAHASQACRYWNALIASVEKSIWSRLARRTWGMPEPSSLGYTWKQYFMMHWNLQVGRHTTHRLRDIDLGNGLATAWGAPAPLGTQFIVQPEEALPAGGMPMVARDTQQESAAGAAAEPKTRRSYVAAWPADPNHAYIVALDAETAKLAWVEADLDPLVITVAKLDDKGVQGKPEYLEGHENAIGLILSNDEGTLVSFDDSSTIIIWNLRTMEFERSINADDELGFIFSMNIHKRRIVTGGQNGRVIVWDANTGDTIWSVQVDEKYLTGLSVQNLLNVAVWEDLVAYGIWDGGFWVGSISEKREIARFDVRQMRDVNARKKKKPASAEQREKSGMTIAEMGGAAPLIHSPSIGHSLSTALGEVISSMVPSSTGGIWPGDVSPGNQHSQVHTHLQQVYENLLTDYPVGAEFSASHSHSDIGSSGNTTQGGGPSNIDDYDAPPLQPQSPAPQLPQQAPSNNNLTLDPPLPAAPTLFPMTLALNGHILLTNGPERHQLAVWDLRSPQGLYTLTSARSSERPRGTGGVNDESTATASAATLAQRPENIPTATAASATAVTATATTTATTTTTSTTASRSRRQNRRARRRALRPPGPDIKFAEISRDGSMIYASIGPLPSGSGGEPIPLPLHNNVAFIPDDDDDIGGDGAGFNVDDNDNDDDDEYDELDFNVNDEDDDDDDDDDDEEENRANQLLVWDYRNREHVTRTRRFEKMRAGGQVDANEDNDWLEPEYIDVWVCWDEIPA